jgi:hypothetical protein
VRARAWVTVAAAALAAVAAVEAGLRAFGPLRTVGNRAAYEYDPELGYRLKSGVHLLETTDHQEEVRTNRLGTNNFQEDFSGYETLIFALGDSYTAGTGLPADAAWPFQLDLTLNRDAQGRYLRRYAVVNLGLQPSGGEQALLLLRRFEARLGRPAYVLYLGCDNDFTDDALFRNGSRHTYGVDRNPRYGPFLLVRQWADRSELARRLLWAWAQRRDARVVRSELGVGDPQETKRPIAALQEPVLDRLAAASREYGARLVMSWSNLSDSYDRTRQWSSSRGIAFADWRPSFESVQQAVPAAPLRNAHSGGHYRTWVNRLIAESFAREITRRSP